MENQYLLGIDNGGTMSKAALFNTAGVELASAARKVEVIEPHHDWSERDAHAMWENTADAIREVITTSAVNPANIACIACTGHGNGLYLIDSDGQPVRNAINSTDQRAAHYIEQWTEQRIDTQVLPQTAQSLWPAQPNALLAWLRDNEPESLAKAHSIQFAKDFIRTQLTGEIHAELTDMSGSSLMNVVTGKYDDSILQSFGLLDMKQLLPSLKQSHDICGKVTAHAATLTGLAEGTPVAAGMFDIDACGLASGIVDEGQMSLVAGTWGNNQYIAREPLIDKDLFMTSCYSIPGWYLMLEGSPTSASNLDWFVDHFFAGEIASGKNAFAQCDRIIEKSDPADTDIIFLPFLYGSNEKSSAKASFLGLEGCHGRDELTRAVFEGIVFSHNHHLQRLLQFRSKPTCIRFTGGASRSRPWAQMFADCFQIPIEIPAGSELGALGAAIAASIAVGIHPDYSTAVEAMTQVARRYDPDPSRAKIYAAKYERYKKAIDALDVIWNPSHT